MDERSCGIPEERWVDLLAGRLQPSEAGSLLRHKDVCPACADRFDRWRALLGAAAAEPAEWPSEAKRERLRRRVRRRGFARSIRMAARSLARQPGGWATAGAAAVLLLFGSLLLTDKVREGTNLPPERYARLHAPEGAGMMSRPDTVVYSMNGGAGRIRGGDGADAKETVWINVRTHELFVFLEGMLPSKELDVQAWATYGGRDANLGVLQFHQDQAHLYSNDVRPELWESLVLTIEPKGGSESPTSPQTAELTLTPSK